MPVHDWTRVSAGIFHDFHNTWIVTLKNALNDGVLPAGYYAISEQRAGQVIPDVLALQTSTSQPVAAPPSGTTAVADTPPRVSLVMTPDSETVYAQKQRTLVVRQSGDHRIVALLEIVSPGNKDRPSAVQAFVEKAVAALSQGYHLLVIDLHPPGAHDPRGMHAAIWEELTSESYEPPAEKPLTLASYVAAVVPSAYVEPLSVGSELPDMPLFLDAEFYVNVSLEETYESAYRGVPQVWREAIEGSSTSVT